MSDMQNEPKKVYESKRYMVFYIIGLFAVALVLILLSYISQVHADRELAGLSNELQVKESQLEQQTSAALGAQSRVVVLQETVAEQERLLTEQKETLDTLQPIIDEIYAELALDPDTVTLDVALEANTNAQRARELISQMGYYLVEGDSTNAEVACLEFIHYFGVEAENVILSEAEKQAFLSYKQRIIR